MAEELFGGQDVGATPSYKEQAYRLIKEAILFNRFRVGAIYSQDDICKELGISRSYVSRIEKRALEKLGEAMEGWEP